MKSVLVALSAGAALLFTACGGSPTGTNPSTGGAGVPTPPAAPLTGAGATFPAPFYPAAFYAYNQKFSHVTVNYQSVGSRAGIHHVTNKTGDIRASDVP